MLSIHNRAFALKFSFDLGALLLVYNVQIKAKQGLQSKLNPYKVNNSTSTRPILIEVELRKDPIFVKIGGKD
jgi:hypothetical protein